MPIDAPNASANQFVGATSVFANQTTGAFSSKAAQDAAKALNTQADTLWNAGKQDEAKVLRSIASALTSGSVVNATQDTAKALNSFAQTLWTKGGNANQDAAKSIWSLANQFKAGSSVNQAAVLSALQDTANALRSSNQDAAKALDGFASAIRNFGADQLYPTSLYNIQ